MKIRLLYTLLVAALSAIAALALTGLPATAETRTIMVRLDTGQLVPVQVDVPPGTPLEDIEVPTVPEIPVPDPTPAPTDPGTPTAPDPGGAPNSKDQDEQDPSRSKDRAKDRNPEEELEGETDFEPGPQVEGPRDRKRKRTTDLRNPDGSPTRQNPTFFDALPGPSRVTGVPNFVIRKFQVPIFLLSIYQAAGIQYGIHWQVLAAINEIETDYGRNLNVSSAGALGWMQFIPSTWRAYGVDANKDGKKDPYNPVDAIFAAARYLKAAGYEQDVRRAIFAYNHADWYVDSVLLRATRIKQMPDDLVSSLTGLTEARFPVAARARYADDLSEIEAERRFHRGENAANLVEDSSTRRGIDIFAREGSPVVAVNDGVIKKIGRDSELGRYVVLQDVYGNRFTYAHLGSVSKTYPVPKQDASDQQHASAIPANDEKPSRPASAGRQLDTSDTVSGDKQEQAAVEARPTIPLKERLFAHPSRPNSRNAGGADQILNSKGKLAGFTTFRNYFSRAFGLNAKDVRLKSLQEGSRVIGGTILGRIGRTVEGKASHVYFEIRPVGRGAPRIDPKPILDGWKLLEATAIYRAAGKNALYGDDGTSIGQVLLMPKPLLEKRVLGDERIEVYPCGRQDIQSGQIDRRVLATLAVLAERGFRATVTSLKCGHGFYTSSGNVSHHSSGNAVDIAMINGIPILGHQEPGGITDQTINVLLQMQGTLAADQIISLIEKGGPTYAMADHADHIHVGFRPLFGTNKKQGIQALAVLKPDQWGDLIARLREIDNPTVPTETSKYAIPVKKHRSSDAHQGE